MSNNITSNNQTGGITAANVTINSNYPPVTAPMPKKEEPAKLKRAWVYIAGGVSFIASIAGILKYLDVTLW